MQLPDWWVTFSGIFFIIGIFVFLGMLIALYFIIKALREMNERMKALSAKVEEAIGEVRQITRNVGGSVSSITNRVDAFTSGATKKLEIFTTIMMLISTAKKMGLFQKAPKQSESKEHH